MLRQTLPTPQRIIRFARQLRKRETVAEKLLWKKFRGRKFHGHKFRRQAPLGPYIVDFLCLEKRLIIEIDGDSHWYPKRQAHDRTRDVWLQAQGFQVMRFSHQDVMQSCDAVLDRIGVVLGCYSDAPPPSPLPMGGGR